MLRSVLPEDLQKYFEYIPDDRLSEVFISLIQEALESRLSLVKTQTVDRTEEVMQSIMRLLQNSSPSSVGESGISICEAPAQKTQVKSVEPVKSVNITDTLDMDDDLGGLMDLLK